MPSPGQYRELRPEQVRTGREIGTNGLFQPGKTGEVERSDGAVKVNLISIAELMEARHVRCRRRHVSQNGRCTRVETISACVETQSEKLMWIRGAQVAHAHFTGLCFPVNLECMPHEYFTSLIRRGPNSFNKCPDADTGMCLSLRLDGT